MAATIKQDSGKIPAVRVTFFTDNKKPDVKLSEGQRLAILRFKTDKDTNTLRSSMAVILNGVSCTDLIHRTDKGSEVLQLLVSELQDSMLRRVADGSEEFAKCEDAQALVSDYLDNSRTASGKRVSSEMVGSFFDAGLASFLMDRIIAKFPAFDADKIGKVVAQYRQAFCDLSKYSLPQSKQVSEMLNKAWSEFSAQESYEDSDIGDWIGERVKKLQDRHNSQEMLIEAI
jgi:hypothetical protein